jgi:hypothetical protein
MTLATATARQSASSGAAVGSITVTSGARVVGPPPAQPSSPTGVRGPWGAPPPLLAADVLPPVSSHVSPAPKSHRGPAATIREKGGS